jgi:hypothetical protein
MFTRSSLRRLVVPCVHDHIFGPLARKPFGFLITVSVSLTTVFALSGTTLATTSTTRRSIPAVVPELLGLLGRAVAVLDVQPHHPQLVARVGRAGVVALVRRVGADPCGVAAPVGEDQLAEAERAGGRVGGGGGEAALALYDPLLGLVKGGSLARTRALVAVVGNRGGPPARCPAAQQRRAGRRVGATWNRPMVVGRIASRSA